MKGRHTASGRPEQPEPAAGHGAQDGDGTEQRLAEDEAPRGGLPKKLALYVVLALCIAFIVWVAWGFLQFDHAIENPREGGFSGWQCDAGRDCGS
ncbi:hypothetical protein DB35_03675 [Streptomyces abyssalis]|uniref:Uncharacterized protein n=1 Tax=Streptomyces abyssalis TaxID=933944 RepID=A0A1E7JQ23_9ACTN|nr:hypothetical protein [Streptomyces abyssalis]OEU90360.1 hypothetical protein AN215_12790 [Streptomyces abyssalis]OEU95097.1 hypothetical protein DB35_03675 [Streptomyces abyssalis]OEV31965.1 hypothetical protein AN219_01605 [Streptomyces nanshensis]